MPEITVIVPTRNRPQSFAQALQSVLSQDCEDFDVIVVDDGSDDEHAAAYDALLDDVLRAHGSRMQVHRLIPRPNGHGPSYVVNLAASLASGAYLAFLDDDDLWTDRSHLSRAVSVIARYRDAGRQLDLYLANQLAYVGEVPVTDKPVWIESLVRQLGERGKRPSDDGTFEVTAEDLVTASGFCHMNCLIVRRELFQSIGGMDESLRWEGDRDLYLRLLDRAASMVHAPPIVSRHNVPGARTSITTQASTKQRALTQARLLDGIMVGARRSCIRQYARLHKGYAVKKLAEALAREQDWRAASYYAWQALATSPTWKWAAYALYCKSKSIAAR